MHVISQFNGRKQLPAYYDNIYSALDAMPKSATLRNKADTLNDAGLTTASGLEWNRVRVMNYIRTTPRSI